MSERFFSLKRLLLCQKKHLLIVFNTYNFYYSPYSPSSSSSSSVSSDYQSDSPSSIDSIIFTKKAKKEGKESFILQALQKSVQGRKDKTRAFVQELHGWQDDGYVDAHYNARVMYDELERLIPIPFGYDVFRRLYNSSRC